MRDQCSLHLYSLKNLRPLDLFRVCGHAFNSLSSALFLFLIILSGIEAYIGNIIGLHPSQFYNYISHRQNDEFGKCLGMYFLWLSLIAFHISFKLWVSDRLTVILRKKLVVKIQEKYFANNAFLDLLLFSSHIDNPDARIGSDCTNWVQLLCSIAIQLTMMPIYVIWYGVQTFKAMGNYAILICLCFAIISIFFSWSVMNPIVRLTYSFEAANGNYRLQNIRINDNSETIALSQGQIVEKEALDQKLHDALMTQKGLANNSIILNMLTNIFNYFGNGLIYICIYACEPVGLSKDDISSYVARVSFVTIQFIYGLTMIILVMQNIAKLSGYSNRIQELWTTLSEHQSQINSISVSNRIEMNNVTVTKPNGDVLIRDLTFSIGTHCSLMIIGPSGSGKSSILRVLGKIWPSKGGNIILPPKGPSSLLVLPQKPYLPTGSLYDCCAFPLPSNEVAKERILNGLQVLNLTHLIARNDADWQIGLSPGEKQRIALIRVFVHQPQFLVLDEATSAISQKLELKFYEKIKEMNISVISVAHHQILKKYHNHLLEIFEDGSYNLSQIDK